jgi:hypothetical protein
VIADDTAAVAAAADDDEDYVDEGCDGPAVVVVVVVVVEKDAAAATWFLEVAKVEDRSVVENEYDAAEDTAADDIVGVVVDEKDDEVEYVDDVAVVLE